MCDTGTRAGAFAHHTHLVPSPCRPIHPRLGVPTVLRHALRHREHVEIRRRIGLCVPLAATPTADVATSGGGGRSVIGARPWQSVGGRRKSMAHQETESAGDEERDGPQLGAGRGGRQASLGCLCGVSSKVYRFKTPPEGVANEKSRGVCRSP